jgi:hypothetical protein
MKFCCGGASTHDAKSRRPSKSARARTAACRYADINPPALIVEPPHVKRQLPRVYVVYTHTHEGDVTLAGKGGRRLSVRRV